MNKKIAQYLLSLILVSNTVFLMAQDAAFVSNLPLEILSSSEKNDVLVLYITGDGGWNKFSEEVSQSFVEKGYSVVALNSRKYFWEAKASETFGQDMERLAAHYLTLWKKSSCIIVALVQIINRVNQNPASLKTLV